MHWPIVVAVVVAVVLLFISLRVVRQYERGVVLTLGKYSGTRQPGLTLVIPLFQTMNMADMRVTVADIKPQDMITADNVSVRVSAVTYFQVVDAAKALLDVSNYSFAITNLAQITLRSTIGKHKLDELLSQQDTLNKYMADILEERVKDWGVKIDHVEIRDVDLDPSMIRAMAQEAEAERGKRARIITAEGEAQAAQKLAEAADILSRNPVSVTLRVLATLKEIGAEQNTTIVFPLPQETLVPSVAPAAAMAAALQTKPLGHKD